MSMSDRDRPEPTDSDTDDANESQPELTQPPARPFDPTLLNPTLPNTPQPEPDLDDRKTPFADEATILGSSPSAKQHEFARPELSGYEIIDELGRGGMGVVYKARDLQLDRTVALKMIIGGKFASNDDIQRFKMEAESAARLDHPGIVPIYDIGEAEGNHFFSMKFIDGDSLANESQRYQSDSRGAAELIVTVARAVQHAHERGVLHRDLKPANILIDESGDPLVTDLGLAKRMDGGSDLTQTGQAMGTPGFMAPEQAQGQKDITTAADIFSLGAILYWLQTGHPPFRGETAVEILVATMEGEIPSVRALNANADGDLDLICQKAMHRDPEQRYTSAAALAGDLEAWLNGELLSVRAPTALSVASIWIRKNLRTVLGSSVTGIACGLLVGGIFMLNGLREASQREHDLLNLGHEHQSWVANFAALRGMNSNMGLIQLLIVPTIAVCAFVNVLLLRPQSREANIVSGVTSSLVAGAVAFLIGVGWQPMSNASIDRGSHDIELLANAMWLESDLERELAQQALIQRYPGLENMDQKTRQAMIFKKVKHDQDVGIIPGMWLGVGFAILFVALPLLLTSILSGVTWLDGIRGWHWFGCTWERSVYCLVFFVIVSYWLRPVPPALHLMLISLSVVAFALLVAVRHAQWYWRVAICLTPLLCMGVLDADMQKMWSAGNRAGLAGNDEDLREHAHQMNRFVHHTNRPFEHYRAGIAWLSLGDEKEYLAHCRQLHSKFENAFRPEIGGRLAKLSLLRPDLHEAADIATFHKLAKFTSSFESSDYKHWFFLTRAISEQRQGHAEEALSWNQRARELDDRTDYLTPCTHAVDALAYLDLNDVANAQKSLDLGRRVLNETRKQSYSDGHDAGWVDWRVFLIFEQEFKTRLSQL